MQRERLLTVRDAAFDRAGRRLAEVVRLAPAVESVADGIQTCLMEVAVDDGAQLYAGWS